MMVNEYIEKFEQGAEELSNKKIEECPPVEQRNKEVEEMIEHYYQYTGKMPKPHALELLGSYILVQELKNKDVDKVTNTDFPILSEIQLKRRARKQMLMQDSTIDFLNTKYNKHIDSLAKKTVKKVDY
ncbi:hypothetical protein [Heyndrickxia ginsengihumi]|uniref:hypothetical protein n=1 Tax=Heyndrickxia ginsengihumi TaxID=363870 RepID=UPI003D1CECE5